jgi:hypothetical protein
MYSVECSRCHTKSPVNDNHSWKVVAGTRPNEWLPICDDCSSNKTTTLPNHTKKEGTSTMTTKQFCSTCGDEDTSNAARAEYHSCGAQHLKVQNEKFRDLISQIGDLASNDKLPHHERLNKVLSMVGRKTTSTTE